MIQAIETKYNGYRFRSRLEARWAVFFDALGIQYEYEKEGYKLSSRSYLPDFWLPELKGYVEIKGQIPTDNELAAVYELGSGLSFEMILVWGVPGAENIVLIENNKIRRITPRQRCYVWCAMAHHAHSIDFSRQCSVVESAYDIARAARFEHGETPQVIERVIYKTVEQDSLVWKDIDIIVRDKADDEDFTKPFQFTSGGATYRWGGIHLNDGGCRCVHR